MFIGKQARLPEAADNCAGRQCLTDLGSRPSYSWRPDSFPGGSDHEVEHAAQAGFRSWEKFHGLTIDPKWNTLLPQE